MNQKAHLSRLWTSCGAVVICLLIPAASFGAGTVTFTVVGGGALVPNDTTPQTISIYVQSSSASTYEGFNFTLQVADGGTNEYNPNNSNPGTNAQDGPMIISANLFPTNGLMTSNYTGKNGSYTPYVPTQLSGAVVNPSGNGESQDYAGSVTTSNAGHLDTLPSTAAILLATVSIDTTNSAAGQYALYMRSKTFFTLNGPNDGDSTYTGGAPPATYVDIASMLTVGTPEPASLGFLGLLLPGLLKRRRRSA